MTMGNDETPGHASRPPLGDGHARQAASDKERTDDLQDLRAFLSRFGAALDASNVAVFTQGRDLIYTAVGGSLFGREPAQTVGLTDDDILPDGSRNAIVALKRDVLVSGESRNAEIAIGSGPDVQWHDLYIEPLHDAGGAVAGISGVAIDITSRKEGEAHLRLLMRELTHRSKNLLAVIQAMARQSALHTDLVGDFVDQFNARLQAMAASHDLLARESWHGVSLAELITSQLGPYISNRAGRKQLRLDGPSVVLRPEAAQSLGLALHELATNAAEYGALSMPAGHIEINWRILDGPDERDLEVVWCERGGPAVTAPDGRGFGSLVIERNLSRAVDAKVKWSFDPEGVCFSAKIPGSQLLAVP